MYLSQIQLSNVRGFLSGRDASSLDVPEEPGWFVFAGRNGAGKSTLLRAVALALAGPDFARQLMPSFASWIRDGADDAKVSVSFRPGASDSLVGSGNAPTKGLSATLTWTRSKDGPEPILQADPARPAKPKGVWRGPWNENPRGWMLAGYGPFRRLTGHAAEAQRAMVGLHHVKRLVSLFYEDASLKEVVEWLKTARLRAHEGRPGAKDLLEGVTALLDSDLLPDQARVDRIDSDGLWIRRAGSTVELHQLSDGYRVALALVLDLVRHMQDAYGAVEIKTDAKGHTSVRDGGVVLIDEVDAHLHVSWQQRIGPWLRERFPNVQFLVTTHSPFVCQAASAKGLFRLPAPGEQRAARAVDPQTYWRVVNGTVDEAVLSDLFGMERSESPRAHALKLRYSELEARRLRGKLDRAEKLELRRIADQLPLPFAPAAAE